MTSILPNLPTFWLGYTFGILTLAAWQAFVKGRLMCFFIGAGHAWAILKEEVRRSIRVIRKAISRKEIKLDEHEEELS